MRGKISLLEVVEVFAKTHIPLAILSAMVTAFTFYHLFMPIFKPPLPSLALALLLAILIEVLKTYSWIWAFAKQVILTRYMAYSVSIGLITISILFHILGAERGTKGELSQAIEKEANYQREEKKLNSQIILELLKNNNGLNAVLLNGTNKDDGKATTAIVENTKFAQMLTSQATKGITGKELLLVKADSVESDQRAIMWLLITAEFLMLFALLSKLIIRFNVDKNQAEFVDLKESLQIELYNAHNANMQGMIDLAKDEIEKVQKQNRNALPSRDNQPQNKTIPKEEKGSIKPENTNNASTPCNERTEEKDEPKKDNILILDLLKYNYLDSQKIFSPCRARRAGG
jgi:UDP-2,3-diacylglucosamine pyrophosphatase LpxH